LLKGNIVEPKSKKGGGFYQKRRGRGFSTGRERCVVNAVTAKGTLKGAVTSLRGKGEPGKVISQPKKKDDGKKSENKNKKK